MGRILFSVIWFSVLMLVTAMYPKGEIDNQHHRDEQK